MVQLFYQQIAADGKAGCTENFVGSSGPTAMASGIIALALEANPDLTWRDVQHLIVRSSQPLGPLPFRTYSLRRRPQPSWKDNAANLSVSEYYGFGLMNADLMSSYAANWTSVPEQLSCEIKYIINGSAWPVIPWTGKLELPLHVGGYNCGIRFLEHVQVKMNLNFTRRGFLEMSSESPGGTQSKLLYSRIYDSWTGFKNFTNWKVTSLHYWGEDPVGNWSIAIRNTRQHRGKRNGQLFSLTLILYGTREDSLANNPHVDRGIKKVETVDIDQRKRDIPVHGGWSQWSYWRSCSKSCGRGTRTRYRYCNNPEPAYGGRDCSGSNRKSRSCSRRRCPVHGGWSEWSSWQSCSKSCGRGTRIRSRSCNNPLPAHGGRDCSGSDRLSEDCYKPTCPGYFKEPTQMSQEVGNVGRG